MYKICGDVETVPCVVSAGGCGWEVRVEAVLHGAEGQSLSGSQAVRPGCMFDLPRKAMDVALLHGQRPLHEWVRDPAPQVEAAT